MLRFRYDQNSVFNVCSVLPHINMRPPYQRALVWNLHDKQLLMDSILKNFSVGKIFWRDTRGSQYDFEVIDGQQRLNTICSFLRNDLSLPSESGRDLEGKRYSELPAERIQAINNYQLDIEIVQGASEEVVRDMFRPLQLGKPLTNGERLKAMYGDIHAFVLELVQSHRLFSEGLLGFANQRDSYVEVAAQMVRLGMQDRPCDVGYARLEEMLDGFKTWNAAEAPQIRSDLDYLARVLRTNGYHPDKASTVSLFLFVSQLRGQFSVRPKQILDFARGFEADRSRARHLTRLGTGLSPSDQRFVDENRDLVDYNNVIYGGTGRELSIRRRHQILAARFLAQHPTLVPRDQRRAFSEEQRSAVYWRDKGICQCCKATVPDNAFDVDHIVTWAQGGRTTVDNGRTLCRPCHQTVTATGRCP
jgi:hypothetical protein